MKKLNDKQTKEVITDFIAGKSKSDIARKFKVSVTAISKILDKHLSLKNNDLSLKSNKEYAKDIVNKAYEVLYTNSFDKLHPETLIKIIERLSLLYKNTFDDEEDNNITKVEVVFEDASIVEDIQQESNNNLNNINGV